MFRWFTIVFFIASLVVGLALRVTSISNKHTWDQDESILFLHATGRNDEFEILRNAHDYPFEDWSSVGEWLPYIVVTEPLNISAINYSMAFKDSHPPFYPWLLHMGMLVAGTQVWLGPVINLLLLVPLLILMLIFANHILENWSAALLLTSIWFLRPAPAEGMLTGRYYILLALLACAVAVLVWRRFYRAEAKPHTWRHVVLLAVVMVSGWLTHIYFPLVTVAALVSVGIRWGFSRRLAGVVAATLTSAVLFILAFPQVFLLLSNLNGMRGTFDWRRIDDRFSKLVNETLVLFTDSIQVDLTVSSFSRLIPWAVLLVIVSSVMIVVLYRARALIAAWWTAALSNESLSRLIYLWTFIFVVVGGQFVLYIAFISPDHAMSARYLTMPFVFLIFVPFLLFKMLPDRLRPIATLTVIFYAVGSFVNAAQLTVNGGLTVFPELQLAADTYALAECETIVTDNNYREIMLAMALHLQPEDRIFAGRHTTLLANTSVWLPELTQGGLYVTAWNQRNGTIEQHDAVINLLHAEGVTVRRVEAPWIFETYIVADGC